MSDSGRPEQPPHRERAETGQDTEPEWRRQRRLAQIFGDVLPETTGDDRDAQRGAGDPAEEWLRSQVPPHHGG